MRLATFASAILVLAFTQAEGALVVGWNFNNATAGLSGNLGTLNTTGTAEVFDTGTELMSIASNGALAVSGVVNLSDLAGVMGGAANNNWGTFAGDLTNAVGADGPGQALAVAGSANNTKTVTFSFSSSGYDSVVLTYATRGTSTGFTTHDWSYSTDGTSFTPFSNIGGRNVTTFSTQTVDLSAVPALNNQSQVFLRVAFSGASGTSGNNRIDNVQINANPIPEPGAAAVLAFGGVALLARRGRRCGASVA